MKRIKKRAAGKRRDVDTDIVLYKPLERVMGILNEEINKRSIEL
ncbi:MULTISPECIES: hypothetical protein [Bacillus]|nr:MULTISPECIES: hypothetical protein [Bacillus]MCU4817361.1 hypothetical protein [Bacillus cereus]MCU4840541.1 hypothetical protein [Bacillus cereus]MCU4895258.1 hypothetical protein [Bacillus cereus]MCU5266767.1 hypothetical protein [Bacillus cereus]MCU5454556.1 hypothetical protein [Bacillus cereus]